MLLLLLFNNGLDDSGKLRCQPVCSDLLRAVKFSDIGMFWHLRHLRAFDYTENGFWEGVWIVVPPGG